MKLCVLVAIFMTMLNAYGKDDNLIQQGAKLYLKRENLDNVYKALDLFKQHLQKEPESVEALWQASMANYYIGHLLEKSEDRKKHFKEGIAQAEKCAEISHGKRVECIFWKGTNLALLKQEKGLFSMAFGLGKIFDCFEKTKELDPTYAGSGPYRMLALLSFKAPGILGGDNDKAYEYIKTAIKQSPNEPLNYHFHAKFLMEDGKEKEAYDLLKEFTAKADPKKFEFYESRQTYKNILEFVKTKKWVAID